MTRVQDETIVCPLCAHHYDAVDAHCPTCPMHCSVGSCCPRCGYTGAGRSVIVDFVQRITWRMRGWLGLTGGPRG